MSAEAIAKEVFKELEGISISGGLGSSFVIEKIQRALESYAEAKVKEAVGNICYWCLEKTPKNDGHICPHLEKARAEGFREGIERAAKVAEKIRAIKPEDK